MTQEAFSTQTSATGDAEMPQTVLNANKVQVTKTPQPTSQVMAGQNENETKAVDCDSYAALASATPITYIPGSGAERNQSSVPSEDGETTNDREIIGVALFKIDACILTRTAFLVAGTDIVHRCTELCPNEKMETNQVREVVAEEWGACG